VTTGAAAAMPELPVQSKYSCGPLIELEQSAEAFVTLDATGIL